jgi:hypothetical protein
VLLRHDLAGGEWHYDWFIEDRAAQQLRSFRVLVDPREALEPFEGVSTSDHRLAYLDYEGPVSGGRGAVTRLWRLEIHSLFLGHRFVRVAASGGEWGCQLHGRQVEGAKWTFRRVRELPVQARKY